MNRSARVPAAQRVGLAHASCNRPRQSPGLLSHSLPLRPWRSAAC